MLLPAATVAEQLAVSVEVVYRLCRAGELAAYRIGSGKKKPWRVDAASLDAYLSRSLVVPAGASERVKPRRARGATMGGCPLLSAAMPKR